MKNDRKYVKLCPTPTPFLLSPSQITQCFISTYNNFRIIHTRPMTERRPWTEQQDNYLRYICETRQLTKWSHISRKLQEQYGFRGRNGKQCKERYTTHIDTSHPQQEWSYSDQQRMVELHNEIGNKWAVIGTKLDGRSDNSVKNHFYSKLRKGLRKVNRIIQTAYNKQIKEFKPNILYRIVEVAEEKFRPVPTYQRDFALFSHQLKNELLEFSYDDEFGENSGDSNDLDSIGVEQGKELVEKINEFGLNYRKKAKKQRRTSGQGQDLLTPDRYLPVNKCATENDEDSELKTLNRLSSETSNLEDLSDELNKAKPKRSRKVSEESIQSMNLDRIRTRAYSQGTQDQSTQSASTSSIKLEKPSENLKSQATQLQGALDGLQIIEQDPPHPLMMRKEPSKYSLSDIVEHQEYHFFEDSQIQMRILPEMNLCFLRDEQFYGN